METLESLRRQLNTAGDLQSVVTTMKALAASSIRQYQLAVEAVEQFRKTVMRGFQILAWREPALARLATQADHGPPGVIVFGSDQGMCGSLNRDIARFAVSRLRESPGGGAPALVVAAGSRVGPELAAADMPPSDAYVMPQSVAGLAGKVNSALLEVEKWRHEQGVLRVLLYHNHPLPGARYEPREVQLLPLAPEELREQAEAPWEGRSLPSFSLPPEDLLAVLVRHHIFVNLLRAFAESLASENAARLAAMQAAERNVEEKMEDLQQRFYRRRQSDITAELMDIVSGFEALKG